MPEFCPAGLTSLTRGSAFLSQVIIFLLKRQWQFIGWLVIYILAFPVYSFFLPLYSFWHFDDFSVSWPLLARAEKQQTDSIASTSIVGEHAYRSW